MVELCLIRKRLRQQRRSRETARSRKRNASSVQYYRHKRGTRIVAHQYVMVPEVIWYDDTYHPVSVKEATVWTFSSPLPLAPA